MKIQECLEKITNVELKNFTPTFEDYLYQYIGISFRTIWRQDSAGSPRLYTTNLTSGEQQESLDHDHWELLCFLRSKVQISPQKLKCTCPSRTLFNHGCKCGGI